MCKIPAVLYHEYVAIFCQSERQPSSASCFDRGQYWILRKKFQSMQRCLLWQRPVIWNSETSSTTVFCLFLKTTEPSLFSSKRAKITLIWCLHQAFKCRERRGGGSLTRVVINGDNTLEDFQRKYKYRINIYLFKMYSQFRFWANLFLLQVHGWWSES